MPCPCLMQPCLPHAAMPLPHAAMPAPACCALPAMSWPYLLCHATLPPPTRCALQPPYPPTILCHGPTSMPCLPAVAECILSCHAGGRKQARGGGGEGDH